MCQCTVLVLWSNEFFKYLNFCTYCAHRRDGSECPTGGARHVFQCNGGQGMRTHSVSENSSVGNNSPRKFVKL